MTGEETGNLLAICAKFDYREVDKTDVAVWHEQLSDLNFSVARAAVMSYYRQETRRIMPADIRERSVPPAYEWMQRR